ncbi:daunorubicin/doxorubicin resistance ABC transporter ATP-binding protein DrrA [Rhodococcus sp. 06-235-1A]|uniref:ABC transporter ATP-binding protein n=1 Tax=Rhodococcus sp. 06-235-1A TaxID=2022508 RepID=UPI000B9B24B9|nr:ATP-binding cassette domain-containing protein [Rhodococcus sp. 06-235-1A]OZD04218.1 daunorubicin/doxorubicin resistance ABC transporter ATP-binding protein DrrA [Rhodococcus sp. 06-235-1A]
MNDSIIVDHLTKHYRDNDEAGLHGIDFAVPTGTICGLLGPNGAGKSTTVKILSTLTRVDSGSATVAGFDVRTQASDVRASIGMVGQNAAVDEILTGRQNLVMFGRLTHRSARTARLHADEALERFGLTAAAERPVGTYSGGMRRRLDLAVSLMSDPPVLFVDEPTTGLDPSARRDVWSAIRARADAGCTVLLTTQYLEEADELADSIVMLQAGRVVAQGTPTELKTEAGANWMDVTFDTVDHARRAVAVVDGVLETEDKKVRIPLQNRGTEVLHMADILRDHALDPVDIAIRQPTLDEVFFRLTEQTHGGAA